MPWIRYKAERTKPTNVLSNVSVRKDAIAIPFDLAKHFRKGEGYSKVLLFMNKETGELGFKRSDEGYTLGSRSDSAAAIFKIKAFLNKHPIEKGQYESRWDPDLEMLIIKVWSIDSIEPEMPENQCPICIKGRLVEGGCSECGFDEAEGIECPHGLTRPLENLEICKNCGDYKRAYGSYPALCGWNQWVVEEEG